MSRKLPEWAIVPGTAPSLLTNQTVREILQAECLDCRAEDERGTDPEVVASRHRREHGDGQ